VALALERRGRVPGVDRDHAGLDPAQAQEFPRGQRRRGDARGSRRRDPERSGQHGLRAGDLDCPFGDRFPGQGRPQLAELGIHPTTSTLRERLKAGW
jgi:hypothetical protein